MPADPPPVSLPGPPPLPGLEVSTTVVEDEAPPVELPALSVDPSVRVAVLFPSATPSASILKLTVAELF